VSGVRVPKTCWPCCCWPLADITDKRTGECPLDVAPLLESIASLETAGSVLRRLHDEPAYRQHLAARGNRQWS